MVRISVESKKITINNVVKKLQTLPPYSRKNVANEFTDLLHGKKRHLINFKKHSKFLNNLTHFFSL